MSASNRNTTEHLNGQIQVSSNIALYDETFHVNEPIRDGLRFIVFLSGDTTIRARDQQVRIKSPSSLAVFSEGNSVREQTFASGIPAVSVLLHISRDLVVSELGIEPLDVLAETDRRGSSFLMRSREADGAVRAVAAQILKAPMGQNGFSRCGKALELAGLVLDSFRDGSRAGASVRLNTNELERVRRAHDILLRSMTEPPSVAALARHCGTNAAKLNRGFRVLYGMTPYAYLQERRLRHAFDLLSTGQASVGQAAISVGYGQTHFATLFRRRFSISPSALLVREARRPLSLEST